MKLGRLNIDEKKLIDRNMAVIGATDSGKSYSVKKLVAETELQVVVLDLEGEYPVPAKSLSPKNAWEGRYLGEWLATHKQSVKVDFSKVKLQEVPAIAGAVLAGLYARRPKGAPPVLVVVDEAYFYAPEAGA